MKTHILILATSLIFLSRCKKEEIIPNINGLSLYWNHKVYGEEGRRIVFEFYGTEEFETEYELKFNYSINQQEILIVLVDVTNQGNCGTYPTPTIDGFDNNCSPKGRVVIPENQFSKGVYILTLKTPNFQIKSEFIVEDDKYELIIPSNDFFSSSIAEDYPMPKNILSGAVVYKGDENTESANNFLDELKNYGFNEIIVPNFDKIPLIDVDKNGNPINRHWPPDKHSLNFYRSMDNNFIEAFNIAQKHFDKSNININIFSSNGDQARLSKTEGVTVVFSN